MRRSSLFLAVVLVAGAFAHADDYEWLNVREYPGSLEQTGLGWSAIRSESGEVSHRIAADDFVITEQTRITAIEFWTVQILDNPLVGIDWYIYTGPPEGPPEEFVASGVAVPTPHSDTGIVNGSFGTIYLERDEPTDLVLAPGQYFLAFRVVQVLPEGEKGIASLTTEWTNGSSRAWWSFDAQADGSVGQWIPMSAFYNADQEWAFRITGETGGDCVADFNGDGQLNIFDFLAYQTAFGADDASADLAAPFGVLNIFDYLAFLTAFGNGC